MRLIDAREKVLRDYIENTPNGAKRLAQAAVSILSSSALARLAEALELDQKVKQTYRQAKLNKTLRS